MLSNVIRFKNWEFDSESGELSCGANVKRLEPTIARLLLYFFNNQNRVISRTELIDHVWGNRIVSDDPINRSVSVLRQTLSPDDRQAFIKTIPRKGYRAEFPANTVLTDVISEQNKGNRAILKPLISLAPVFAIAFLLTFNWVDTSPQEIAKPRLAILPFEDLSRNRDYGYLTDGVTDTITHLVSSVKGIEVTARSSAFRYKESNLDLSQIADELYVDFVLQGSVQVANDQMRILARLTSIQNEKEIWSMSFTRGFSDVFSIQDEIANAVTVSLNGIIFQNLNRYQPKYETYQLVLKGLEAANRMTRQDDKLAVSFFDQAIANEPDYPAPYIRKARVLLRQVSTNTYLQIYPTKEQLGLVNEVKRLTNLALNLNPLSSDAQALKALLVFNEGKKDYAEQLLIKALELDSSNANALADYSSLLQQRGDIETALQYARQAQALDPTSNKINRGLAQVLWLNSRAEEAVQVLKTNAMKNPLSANNYSLLARWSTQLGKPGQAMLYAIEERKINSTDANAHWGVCLMHYQLWQREAGNQCSARLLETFPEHAEAKLWPNYDKPKKAIELLQQRIEALPDVVYHRLQISRVFNSVGRYDEVLEQLKPFFPQLFTQSPPVNDWTLWPTRLIAEAYVGMGDKESAAPLLSAGLAHIERSRKLQAGGFSSGVEDVHFLILMGEYEQGLQRLSDAIDNRWAFYSMFLATAPMYAPIRDWPEYQALVERQKTFMAEQVNWYQARL